MQSSTADEVVGRSLPKRDERTGSPPNARSSSFNYLGSAWLNVGKNRHKMLHNT